MKIPVITLVLLLTPLCFGAGARPALEKGEVCLPNTTPPFLLYRYELSRETSGNRQLTHTRFLTSNGSEAVIEELVHEQGKLQSYSVDRKQEGVRNTLSIRGNKAFFETVNLSTGEKKTDDADWDDSHVVLPDVKRFALSNWDALLAGRSIDFRLALPEKQDTYGFTMKTAESATLAGKPMVTLKLSPSSLFVSMVMSSIYLDIDPQTKSVRRLRGFTFPKPDAAPNATRDIESDLVYLLE